MPSLGTLSFETKLNAQAVKDAEQIKKQVLHKLGNSIPLKLKVSFTSKDLRADLQNQLNKFKPKVKVDIVVDQVTATQAVQQALAKAGLMNNMTAGQLRAQRAAEIQQRMQLALAKAQMQAAHAADRHSKSLLTLNSHFGNGISLGGRFSATVASIYSVYTLKNFVQSMIEIGGEFQKQRIALENMLGSVEKANALYSQMKGLAVESPFTFMDLMSYTKQLKAFQIPYNELFETTKRLGDISAGLGVDMNRLILAFGQVRSAAVLRGQEVRQFTEAGIPLLDALAKKFSELEGRVVSVGDVFEKISKRQVSFGMVKDVLWELTNEGGQFYNMQEKLTESLSGKLDKLKDSYQIMIGEMAQGNNAVLGGMLDILIKLVQYADKAVGVLGTLTFAYIAYKAAVIAASSAQKIMMAIETAQAFLSLARAVRSAKDAMLLFSMVTKANPIGLVVSILTTAIGLFFTFKDVLDDTAESTDNLSKKFGEADAEARSEEASIKLLFDRLRNAKEGTEEYLKVKNQIIGQYGQYLKGLSQEIQTLKNVEAAYNAVAKAARNAAMARGKEAALKETMDTYGKTYSEFLGKIRNALKENNLRDDQIDQYIKYVKDDLQKRGQVSKDVENSLVKVGAGKISRSWFGELKNNETFLKENTRIAEELFGITDQVDEKAKRNELWWQKASQYAGDFKNFAPNLEEDFKTYADRVGKELNSVEAEIQKRTPGTPDYASLVLERDTLKDIYTDALKMRLEGLSKFKSGGSGSDKQLKQWEEDFAELQAFYQEYVKWARDIGEENALKKLYETGLWGNLFDDKGKLKYNMRSWSDAIKDFREKNGVVGGTTGRDKFLFKTQKAELDFEYDINKKDLDRALEEVNEYINKQSSKFNLYKSLLEKTGSKDFAMAAFEDGQVWDEAAKQFEAKLKELSGETEIDYTMTDAAAKKHFEGVQGGYELWKKIVEIISGNYVETLNNGADAYSKTLTSSKELLKVEQELNSLIEKRNNPSNSSAVNAALDAQIKAKEKERNQQKMKVEEETGEILQFYTAILSMTEDQAERVGRTIRENLVQQLKDGTISADEYSKKIKRIDSQLEKTREKKDMFELFRSGGIEAVRKFELEVSDDKLTDANNKLREKQDELKDANEKLQEAIEALTEVVNDENSTEQDFEAAQDNVILAEGNVANAQAGVEAAEQEQKNAQTNRDTANKNYQSAKKFNSSMAAFAYAIHLWAQAYDDAKKAAAAYGENLDASLNETGQAIMGTIQGVDSGLQRAQSGDILGAVSGIVFGTIANIANMHDETLKEDQKNSQLIVQQISNMTESLERALERNLGGIYTTQAGRKEIKYLYNYLGQNSPWDTAEEKFRRMIMSVLGGSPNRAKNKDTQDAIDEAIKSESLFDVEYAQLLMQRDQLYRQLEDEQGMKNKDESKIEDYKSQIEELEDQIEHFAEDVAKSLYDIDIKSWASELGDALFDAWLKGEDGAEAFQKKARDIIADVAKKIAVTKLIETALKPVLDAVTKQMEENNGVLDAESIAAISEAMSIVGTTLPDSFNALMDGLDEGLQKAGLGSMKDDADESSSLGSGIKSITENTADLLASYVNAIRADVSMIRIQEAVSLPSIQSAVERTSVLAETQVTLQQQIAANTLRNADAADKIYDIMHKIDTGVTAIKWK